jgi:hypothetical protein
MLMLGRLGRSMPEASMPDSGYLKGDEEEY